MSMKFRKLIAAVVMLALHAFCFAESTVAGTGVSIQSTSVEYASNPLGIDTPKPRLSWILGSSERNQKQSAYQVKVATSLSLLARPDVWDSGKVATDQSALVSYGGAPLLSRTRYYWAVRVWDAHGQPSAWSKPSWWEMGLLAKSDWQAQWIGHDQVLSLPAGFNKSNQPAQLNPSQTQGQSFTSSKPFSSVSASVPTFVTTHSGMTLSLYEGGPGGKLVARHRFNNQPDNAWGTLKLRKPAAPGKYYLEQSNVTGKIGWWSYDKGGYEYGEAYANGKPTSGDRKIRWDTGTREQPESPAPELRKEFVAKKQIQSARLYTTALGLYQAEINGHQVGEDFFAPGWTDYNRRVQYQTYDVTDLVRSGKNAIGVTLAPGWYAGDIGSFGPDQYGPIPYALAQLELKYSDGSIERIVTDNSWKSKVGPIVSADLIMGEKYDARKETPGWSSPGFDDTGWKTVQVKPATQAQLVAQVDPPVRMERELEPVKVTHRKPSSYIFDLGQNMVGTVRLRVTGKAGQVITIRHAEVLNGDGTIYTTNLRTATATDTYVLKGQGEEVFEPNFTVHGFRYVEVTGSNTQPQLVGRVLHTAAPFTLSFETDVPMLNQLQSNIAWGQRGNFLSIPTDTPARDERLGWTGDIAAFAGTGTYNMESAQFLSKWLTDLRDTQSPDGAFSDVAPAPDGLGIGEAGAGWGDAGVIVPWVLYERYGDRRVLEQNFDAMVKWLSYLKANSTGYLRPNAGYGDWLNIKDETPKDLIATAFFANSAAIVAKAAVVLGKDPAPYEALFANIRGAFNTSFVLPDGRIKGNTQTAYVLALTMDLLPTSLRKPAADHLVELIKARGWHLSTGFLGTPRLLPALSETGHMDVAYRLLLQTSFPSWGYQIGKGATTMWERWDAIRPNGAFQDARMNSFNHYAYGSVGEWMYQDIAGIRPGSPGFQKIVIKPTPGDKVHSATSRYDSPYGPIAVSWQEQKGQFSLDVEIPVNASAEIWVPASKGQKVEGDGANLLYRKDDWAVYQAGSGKYHFSVL
ncbi:alpha-L-rhamnosidase [Paraburkholderia phenazinium]|uniref:alpha-L-rhamnosidase n=2 Tax=Paraburkholderia phenazinium TaxID=60549 RepID=A0A1G8HZ93_9BURK|nr:glycoside hydrolase family 78 protein [Paraburkholderia phenazinium]SDI11760.1 alpha-L-rhamnosidase [Paraburkholderia phenazinium]